MAFMKIFGDGFQAMVMTFLAAEPAWRCVTNSTVYNVGNILPGHASYELRCHLSRNDWEFNTTEFNSIVSKQNPTVKKNGKDIPQEEVTQPTAKQQVDDVRDLFGTLIVCQRTLASWILWAVVSMVNYGVSFSAGSFGGNRYLAFFLVSILELPSHWPSDGQSSSGLLIGLPVFSLVPGLLIGLPVFSLVPGLLIGLPVFSLVSGLFIGLPVFSLVPGLLIGLPVFSLVQCLLIGLPVVGDERQECAASRTFPLTLLIIKTISTDCKMTSGALHLLYRKECCHGNIISICPSRRSGETFCRVAGPYPRAVTVSNHGRVRHSRRHLVSHHTGNEG
ncbi:predicted protein [Nematostella vectensis]|uniref:Uncharacterized protein n=1 Tax=Nematostella vectensis TaxID=45351 RepID=A7SBG7_NEMVE|nr:predicted protein [Nematostella vectensis]|eukprot:XP_001630981.1 predicted protein [Nematostella vectensis]